MEGIHVWESPSCKVGRERTPAMVLVTSDPTQVQIHGSLETVFRDLRFLVAEEIISCESVDGESVSPCGIEGMDGWMDE